MIKVFYSPSWHGEKDTGQGGIKRVWENLVKYLPRFGVEATLNINEADIIATHGGAIVQDRPEVPRVSHNHGLMWSRQEWGANYQEVNQQVIDSMAQAKAHTAPSEWVAVSLRRGMLIYPEVIHHGIDASEWQPSEEPKGFVLWNKARADFVSNPWDMNETAKRLPHRNFVSTFGKPAQNIKITGKMPYDSMKSIVQDAGVYLCTARETFGINTLEAMAAGVPVAGFRWGGQQEIILHGETGYLATPGNFDELAWCIEKCFEERARLSENCLVDVKERWAWEPRIKQYADIYKRVHRFYNIQRRPKVTVLVTAYNLDQFLPQCLDSVKEQTMDDFECIVIGGEADSTRDIVLGYAEEDKRIRYMRTKNEIGLTGRRNFGMENARGLYIRHLDADDWLHKRALEIEAGALDEDINYHIVYGPLQNVNEKGKEIVNDDGSPNRWGDHDFSWRAQMAHLNQIPSCCMARREVFERSGGYRIRQRKAEDAHFWCLVTSMGFRAKRCTKQTTMYHRMRSDSKGALEWKEDGSDGNWTAWFPWNMGASNNGEGRKIVKSLGRNVPEPHMVPFGAQGGPPPGYHAWPIADYAYPVVSIVVTVGPGHEKYIQDCLDSILAQTYPDWECIVVNDTGKEWNQNFWQSPLSGYPWAKYVSTGGNYGVSRARNLGAQFTMGKAIVPFDVDDHWFPWTLDRMVRMVENNDGIVYGGHMVNDEMGNFVKAKQKDFDCKEILRTGLYPGSSILIPRWVHDKIVEAQGGWDEDIPGREDWDYQICAHSIAKACAYRVKEPIFVYRVNAGSNRKKHDEIADKIEQYIERKWFAYRSGEKEMCGCSKGRAINSVSRTRFTSSRTVQPSYTEEEAALVGKTVYLKYTGPMASTFTTKGPVTGTNYRFANQGKKQVNKVFAEDARELVKHISGHTKRPLWIPVVQDGGPPITKELEAFLTS